MLQKRTKTDYLVSGWSGGTTTQLAIFPPEASYADRDFLWRVSSATVELEESDFTSLPDYDRLISTLEGEIELTHNGGEPLTLRPFEVHAFSGANATHSRGRCTDFNLMLRRGRAAGTMEVLRLSDIPMRLDTGAGAACPPVSAGEQLLLYCAEGTAQASPIFPSERSVGGVEESVTLAPGEALLLTEPVPLTLSGPAVLMVCRITIQ